MCLNYLLIEKSKKKKRKVKQFNEDLKYCNGDAGKEKLKDAYPSKLVWKKILKIKKMI
jgi:hypothetical protein